MAPELLDDEGNPKPNQASDVWALGCVMLVSKQALLVRPLLNKAFSIPAYRVRNSAIR